MKKIAYIVLIILIAGCNSIEDLRLLNDIESYIAERPDSALAVIESIDADDLKTKGLKAHHALLHAMALDKNYIDVTDDSLALTALNFYRYHGPKKNLARAMYYYALSYYYDGQYDKSIIELANAEPVAEKYDSLYLGFIKVLQADTYSINFNSIEEMKCREKALEIYTDIDAQHYINVAKLGLAISYMNNNEYKKAETLFNELLNSDELNERLQLRVFMNYAFFMATRPDADYDTAAAFYEKVSCNEKESHLTAQDFWVWAYSLSKIGKSDRSKELVNDLKQVDSSGTAYYFMYAIAKNENNNIEALEYLEKYSDKNNDEVIEILKQSISVTQRDHYLSLFETAEYKARSRLTIMILICIVSVLLGTLICISTIRYRNKKEEEKNEYIRYAEEVIRQLKELQKDSYTSLQKKYISLYKTKYDTVRNLYEKYLHSDGRTDAEHLIYKKVVSIINEVRNDMGNSTNLERILNEDLNEINTLLHTELPDLSKKDHFLLGYLALGFDVVLISHFMNCTPNSIYIRKSRLKKIIEESDTEHKDVFMEMIR